MEITMIIINKFNGEITNVSDFMYWFEENFQDDINNMSSYWLEIYIDDVAVDSEDYTIDGDDVIFDTPPADTEVVTADYRYECEITADYTVPYIPKSEYNLLDVSMEITFGETEVTP